MKRGDKVHWVEDVKKKNDERQSMQIVSLVVLPNTKLQDERKVNEC